MNMSAPAGQAAAKIRVGLVGAGNWARHGHLRVLALLPAYEIVAVYARRREAAASVAAQFGIPHIADSIEELVRLPEVDMVIVLNTAPQHEQAVRAAIGAGKHVYCEWPLTVNARIAAELRQLADEAGVRHVVGLQRRLAPHNRYLRDLLAQGYVGQVRSVRLHVSMNYFQAVRSHALRWTVPPANFSSVIAIYAGHFLDMLFHATGRPRNLAALMVNQFKEVKIAETGEILPTTTPDQLVLAGTLEDGAVLSVHIEGGKRNGSGVQLDITGDEGDLSITNSAAFGGAGDDYVIRGAHGDNIKLAVLDVPAAYNWLPESDLPSAVLELANLYAAFARDLAENTHSAPSFNDAVWLHELIEACDLSSRRGERVAVRAAAPETAFVERGA